MYIGVKGNFFIDNYYICIWILFFFGKIEKLILILYYFCRFRNFNLLKFLGYVKFLYCGI